MDSLRGQDEIEAASAYDDEAIEAPPVISGSERRMQVRAYNYWVSLLGNRSFPSIEDLNPQEMEDFSANSVLLDFSLGLENPAIIYLGSALREECGIVGGIDRIDQVPARSLLSRLTDHYLQIIANSAPVGFEAEFVNQRSVEIMYRGILMPFSSNDETIDFIYGVINWKEAVSQSVKDGLDAEIMAALNMPSLSARSNDAPLWQEGPSSPSDFGFDEEEARDEDVRNALPIGEVPDALELSAFSDTEIEALEELPSEQDDVMDLVEVAPHGPETYLDDLPEEDAPLDRAAEAELDLAAFEVEDVLDLAEPLDIEEPLELMELAPAEDILPELDDLEESLGFYDAGPLPEAIDVEDGAPDEAVLTEAAAPELVPEEDIAESDPEPFHDIETAPFEAEPEDVSVAMVADLASTEEDEPLQDCLNSRLQEAQKSAAAAGVSDVRSRSALYDAIGRAYDFALATETAAEEYAVLLEQAEISVQARSPNTAIIKLVFGPTYDKTRIAEYACAIDYAFAQNLEAGSLSRHLLSYDGGLKGLVRDMRAERRAEKAAEQAQRPARAMDRAVRKLSAAKAVEAEALSFDEHGLAVLVARREADGGVTLIAGADMADAATRKILMQASKAL